VETTILNVEKYYGNNRMEKTITVKIKVGSTIELRYAIYRISQIIDFVGVNNADTLKVK